MSGQDTTALIKQHLFIGWINDRKSLLLEEKGDRKAVDEVF